MTRELDNVVGKVNAFVFRDITPRNADNNVESVQYQKSTYRMRVSFYSDYFEIDATFFT